MNHNFGHIDLNLLCNRSKLEVWTQNTEFPELYFNDCNKARFQTTIRVTSHHKSFRGKHHDLKISMVVKCWVQNRKYKEKTILNRKVVSYFDEINVTSHTLSLDSLNLTVICHYRNDFWAFSERCDEVENLELCTLHKRVWHYGTVSIIQLSSFYLKRLYDIWDCLSKIYTFPVFLLGFELKQMCYK